MPGDALHRLVVDVSSWPLVIITHEGRPGNAALEAHLAEIERDVLGRSERFAQVIDQRAAARPDAVQRDMIGEHQTRMADAYARLCAGEAYVGPRELRGAMTAVFWREPPRYPVHFVESLDEGLAWARARLGERA